MPRTSASTSSHSPVCTPTHRQPLRLGRVHDAQGAPDGTGGAVEHREDTATEMLDLLTAEAGEMGPDVPVVGGQQLTPGVVTQVDGSGA